MEQTVCSETLAYKIQTLGNYPEESIQHSEHNESLKKKKYSGQKKPLHKWDTWFKAEELYWEFAVLFANEYTCR